jgi:hypothetical protein
MAENETRIRTNKFDVEWQFAKRCWTWLSQGLDTPQPAVPNYSIWKVVNGKETFSGSKPISPKRVSCAGVVLFP